MSFYGSPPPPPRPAPRRGRAAWIIVAVLSALAIGCCGVVIAAGESSKSGSATPARATVAAVASAAPVVVVYSEPKPADFTVSVVELTRKCFGSAGCNVTFTVNFKLINAATFDPSKTYYATYRIDGAEDLYTNKAELSGGRYEVDAQEFVSVKRQSTVLTAVVTQIVER